MEIHSIPSTSRWPLNNTPTRAHENPQIAFSCGTSCIGGNLRKIVEHEVVGHSYFSDKLITLEQQVVIPLTATPTCGRHWNAPWIRTDNSRPGPQTLGKRLSNMTMNCTENHLYILKHHNYIPNHSTPTSHQHRLIPWWQKRQYLNILGLANKQKQSL